MKVYIAGPMSGLPDLNFPAFHAAAAALRRLGLVVINPAEINADHDAAFAVFLATVTGDEARAQARREHWRACMRRDIAELVTCDAIALLPGWENSRGATLEHHNAQALGLEVGALHWWIERASASSRSAGNSDVLDHRVVSVPGFWCDHKGKVWPIVRSHRRLKFKYPAHAALRAFVHHRDGYRCLRCGVQAIDVPEDYDGRHALSTAARTHDGWAIALVCDHILTLKAGGESQPSNLQSLCETCNREKLPEDLRAIAVHREQASRGSL